jgi:hypothetical protein
VIIVLEPVDDTRDAISDERHLEVDEQAQALVGKPEIGQMLLLVDWSDQLDGFDFDYNLIFDNQIGSESGVDTYILVYHRNWLLAHRARLRRPGSYAKTV